ncbi:MAG: PhoPQ-activated protein PqaA family protein [Planctomycetota bacterium]
MARLPNPDSLRNYGAFMLKKTAYLILALFVASSFSFEALGQEGLVGSKTLKNYVSQTDDSYRWEVREELTVSGCDVLRLHLTSQTWRDISWKHVMYLIRPNGLDLKREDAVLVIGGGSWRPEWPDNGPAKVEVRGEAQLMASVAQQFGCVIAVLSQVPMQPIMGDKYEDEIIAATFAEYIRTGEPTWPLLLPMVKSAVRGMDTAVAAGKEHWNVNLKEFTVTGASKRGWTTWLTGATDPRATVIAPMVIDMLNMNVQMKHQLAAWGKYSEQIADYTELDLPRYLDTPAGKNLQQIVDPFSYREDLKQSKLLIFGTNDRYWPVDASNNYWEDLKSPKYLLHVPNQGHGIDDYARVIGSIRAIHRSKHVGEKLPDMDWSFDEAEGQVKLSIEATGPVGAVRAFVANSANRDFRNSNWKQMPCKKVGDNRWECTVPKPEAGHKALFGEIVTKGQGMPGFFSTNIGVFGQ